MRKINSIIALALVFAMAFTFTAGAVVDFTDADTITKDYADDVNMLVELGVISGYPDGSFGPKKNITRAEFAKMAYTIIYGSDADGDLFAAQKSEFWDVEGNASVAWAKGYINYCANNKIVSGVGGGKFNPQGNITVAEASKMLLVILGCDPAKEGFTGANWMSNVVAKAMELGVYDGWQGDPAALATRELVAKLMANTILSSTYTYSSITGIGSQKDALGQTWNDTLGEKTMGLKTVTGIVVANERYVLETDEKGELITDYEGDTIAVTAENEAMVLYETKETNGSTTLNTITIDRALSDDMLGSKVNVFFKADKREESKNGVISYVNIKVIGEVIVNSDTVVHTVPAIDVDVYPNGDSSSSVKIQPYISVKVNGEEKKISTSSTVNEVAKNVDAQTDVAARAEIAENFDYFAYVLDGATLSNDGAYIRNGQRFLDGMGADANGKATNAYYRFVSNDGGKTFSYMFKLNDVNDSIRYEGVTSINEARGTVKVTGHATFDMDDVVLGEGVEVDDSVVVYRANGKVYIDKVETFNGTVDEICDDGSVIINGQKYWAEENCDLGVGISKLSHFYRDNLSAMDASTQYTTYNGMILEIKLNEEVNIDTNFAIITNSYYVTRDNAAYVTITTTDNKTETYEIGKLYTVDKKNPNATVNDRPMDFAKNNYFGRIIEYKILDDGRLDLSMQFLKDNNDGSVYYYDGSTVDGKYDANGVYRAVSSYDKVVNAGVFEDVIAIEEKYYDARGEEDTSKTTKRNYYALNENTTIFLLYGEPYFLANGEPNYNEEERIPVKASAYKVSQLKHIISYMIPDLYVGGNTVAGGIAEEEVISLKFNTAGDVNKAVVCMGMTVGEKLGGNIYQKTTGLAYVVSATQKMRVSGGSTSKYATFTIIDEKGCRTLDTVDGVQTLNSASALDGEIDIGSLSKKGGKYEAGSFVRYSLDSEGKIAVLDNDGATKEDIKKTFSTGDGLYLVIVTGERNGVLTFIDPYTGKICNDPTCPNYGEKPVHGECYLNPDEESDHYTSESEEETASIEDAPVLSCKYHDNGYKIIGISEGEHTGETIDTLSRNKKIVEKNWGNAIIQIEEGKIVRVFSFNGGEIYN